MVVDNVEHPLGVVYRFRGTRRPHWLIISGRAIDPLTTTVLNKSKFPSDTESNWLVFLEWPYNFSWRIFIILNIYMTILLTVMMGTTLVDLIILIVIQHILSLFFLIDFLLAVLHRIIYLPAKVLTCKRSYLCLVIEAISMLPLAVLYMIIVPNYEQDMVFFLSCIVGLRFYRIHQFFNEESYAAGVAHIKFTILKFSLYFFLTNFIFAMLWMRSFFASLSNDFWQIWEDKHGSLLLTALYFALMTFTNTGYGDIRAKTTPDKIACTIAMLVGFILVTGVLIGSLTKDLLQREEPREKYRREFHSTVRYLKEHSLGPNTVKKIMEEMNTLWNYKKGVTDHVTENLLPIPLRKEISFDIVFGFLYRSILFANQDRTFLRSISLIMRNKTYLPGDEIVRPTGILHGMICVTSGIVEILSVENDSSPIISFTAGTVLGEISLFLAIPIKIIIRASTIVELQVLDAMDFYRLAMKFTSNCSAMRADIIKRCKESRKILLNDETKSLDPEEPANLRLKTLKELIKNLKTSPNPGDVESTKLDAFKANITNLYVIMENLPKVKVLPLTLMRNKPWILRPDTPLTYTWDVLMFIVVSFVLIYYPYVAAFYRQIDTFGYMVLFSVEIVYIVDLFKQCITAVPRDDLFSYKTEVKEIVLTRLRSYGFYLDVLSTYELSVFTPLFNFGTRDHMLLILSLNKMLRFWIVPRLFDTMENQFTRSLLFIRIIKYIYYVFLAVHNAASFLYLEACPSHCYADRWFHFFHANRLDEGKHQPTVLHPYIISVYLAVMLTSTTGYGNILPASDEDMVTMMVLMILGLITFTFVISQLSGTLKHIERKKTQYQEEIYAIDRFLKEHNMPQQLRERMRRYFRVQWSYDRGRSFHRTIEINQLPKKLRTIMLNEKLTTLQSVPIFKHAHPGFMLELAKGCQVRVLPDKEMVVYAGSLDREMYILQSGYCTMHNKNRPGEFSVIGAYTSFGDLEMIQGVPIVLDVKTLTHVRIICIEYATYMRAVTKYPDVSRHIEQMMKTTKITASSIDLSRITVTEKRTRHMFQPTVWQRFWTCLKDAFINVYKYDKRHNRDYWEPFQNWNKLSFLRYIFLPIVLKPDSTVLRVWMTIRVLACIFVGFLAPIYFTLPALMMKITGWILMFQFIIWIDLYLTFHLAYYDQKGVLIFHPAKTVPHYIKGSFFLDLIISFPYFTLVRRWIADHRPSFVYNGCGLIKVLQYYKFLQVCNAYETDILRRSASLKLLKYLPTILIVTNLLAAMLILIECQSLEYRETLFDLSTHGSYRAAIQEHCSRPLGSNQDMDFEMYLIAYYYITASMTSCGFGDVIPTNNTNVVACVFTIMFGVFIYGSMFASIAGSKIFAYYNVTIYRTQMREMMTFLGKGNVSEKLKRRIFMHYLQTWGRTYGYTPQKTLSNVHTVLKQDIVDWMYESTLRKVAVFNFVDKYFIRCVGKYIDEIYFLEGEEICKHNHLQDEIYIIYRGKIDILDADGNFVTSMGGGGLFGNMTNKSTALSAITAVAATNVELIRMKSDDFHKTLVIYPNIKKEIVRLTSLSPDYISPTAEMDYITVDNVEIDSPVR
ncbi:UNVERIFIED_CONTAM: hypothetical protein PYX00_011209 [Menopon gallinae]|uniref:Cyclic nucleotide-binding domain-containing protein n=2 Tax=Menopon gallinae TaxID=328185 RepID=A0AAW2H786_9NEOP